MSYKFLVNYFIFLYLFKTKSLIMFYKIIIISVFNLQTQYIPWKPLVYVSVLLLWFSNIIYRAYSQENNKCNFVKYNIFRKSRKTSTKISKTSIFNFIISSFLKVKMYRISTLQYFQCNFNIFASQRIVFEDNI